MLRAIEMRTEFHSVLGDLDEALYLPSLCRSRGFFHLPERKYLKSPAIRENREVDVHKFVEPSEVGNGFVTGSEIEMVGIGKHDLAPDFEDMILMDSLYARLSSDRHKNRGLYISMGSREGSCSCESIGGFYLEIKHRGMGKIQYSEMDGNRLI